MMQSHNLVKMDDFDVVMMGRLQELQENISDAEGSLREAILSTWNSQAEHNASYHAFEHETQNFMRTVDDLQEKAARDEMDGMNGFRQELEHAEKSVRDADAEMSKESAVIFGNTSTAIEVLSSLDNRAADAVTKTVADLQHGLRHSDSELSKLVELEQYQEDHVLDRVAGDIGALDNVTSQLRVWRDLAQDDQMQWRSKVSREFEQT